MGWKDDPVASPWERDAVVKPPQSVSDGVAASFGQGVTMGFGDEIAAGVRAAFPQFSNWMMRGPELRRDESIGGPPNLKLSDLIVGKTPDQPQTVSIAPTFGDRYAEELAKSRAALKDFQTSNPILAGGSQIAGNVATIGALPLKALGTGGLVMQVGKNALAGGVLGGVQGFGEGEGDFETRARNGVFPGLVGAATGAAAPVVGKGIGMAYDYLAPKVLRGVASLADKITPTAVPKSLSAAAPDGGSPVARDSLAASIADSSRNAATKIDSNADISRLATEIARNGGVDKARARLNEIGEPAFIADTSKGAERLANVGYTMPGDAANKYTKAFTDRAVGARDRVVKAFEGNEPPPSTFDLRGEGRGFDSNLRAVGSRVYGDMKDAGLKQTPELMQIYENPHVAGAIDRVMATEKSTRIGTDRAPSSPVEIMHKVKQAIWDLGFDKETARPGPMASWYRDLGIEYMNRLKAANPALREADAVYSAAARLPEHFDAGYNFLAGGGLSDKALQSSAPSLSEMIARSTPQQAIAARAGEVNAVRDLTGGLNGDRKTQALVAGIKGSRDVPEKIAALHSPEDAARIMRTVDAEHAMNATKNAVLSGSQTAQRAASLADDAAISLPQGSGASLLQMLVNGYNKMRAPNEAMRSRLADLLANPDPAANAETLALVAEALRRQAATRSLVTPSVSGAAAGSASAP